MGHTNSTVNYNLPQFVGTDKPSWLGDVNGAFLAIDNAIAAAKTEADSAAGGVAGLQTTVGSHTTQIGTLTDTVTAQGGTLNTVTALIGNGEPTTTDKTLIGAINELNAENPQLVGSVVGDGTKTYNQLLSELYTAFISSGKTFKPNSYVELQNGNYAVSTGNGSFISLYVNGSQMGASNLYIGSTPSYYTMNCATGGNSVTDVGSTVASSGYTIKLYV